MIAPFFGRDRGAALLIVLALVVLVTGLVVAFFSRVTSDRPVSHGSFNQTKSDQLAASATDNIIGDLRQEIILGSAAPTAFGPASSPSNLYVPSASANIVLLRSPTPAAGTTPAIPNLIRRNVRSEPANWSDATNGPARGSRASAVNSMTDPSANKRSVSLARWNTHYLIPKANTGDDSTDPITSGFTGPEYWAPDWVFIKDYDSTTQQAGAAVITAPSPLVIGRYAYVIYDEGGLIDMNAAGYPSPTTILQFGRKGSLAFTDLTGLGSYGLSPTGTAGIDALVGWRNYASAKPSGNFGSTLAFNTTSTNNYYNFVLSDPTNIKLVAYSPNSFLKTSGAPVYNDQTDQAFVSRQELIAFRNTTQFPSNALQYLCTFSREAAAATPQWSPAVPTTINPNFQNLWVTGSFTRNDGSIATEGEYLVNKRFLLQRLNWLTYMGPSALRTIPISSPALTNQNYDMWLLVDPARNFRLTTAFLQQGTAANILKYFGLAWDAATERWNYVGHAGSTTPIASLADLGTLTSTREPDFFELLRAGILDSSLGDSASPDTALPVTHQQSKMLQILTIGANLIAQSRADSYPVRIACTVGTAAMEGIGMPRLPYLNSLSASAVGATQTAGGIHWFLMPNLWNAFRDNWDLTKANSGDTTNMVGLTPGYLRPAIRIRVNGQAAFGSVVATGSVSSGSAASGVTPFPTGSVTVANHALTLAEGISTGGRDAFLQASRLRTGDFSAAVTQFTTTDSPATFADWSSLTTTGMPAGARYIVYRLSLAGANIPSTALAPNQHPVLILKPQFQMALDYQSPNGQWYPYSSLQGNNESSTWISSDLSLVTNYSAYGMSGSAPTLLNLNTTTPTPWALATVAAGPMFAKADPRTIRYNSQIGVVNLTAPPLASASAGGIGSIWPNLYPTPPPMWTTASPGPTPSPNPNPVGFSQTIGDNAPSGTNPYNESNGDAVRPIVMNRPFRSVGEMAYASRDQPFKTLDFSSSASSDAGLLDLFTVNDYSDSSGMRAGVVNLNSAQGPALAAILKNTIRREDTPRVNAGGNPSPSPSPVTAAPATSVAASLVSLTTLAPVVNRASLASLNGTEMGLGPTVTKTQREAVVRALGETVQTRTWNLMIDVIAQSGRYSRAATAAADLPNFIVEGEQRYWVHVAIDRFTGQVIDRQIEVVNE
jgi:hypothetical protein